MRFGPVVRKAMGTCLVRPGLELHLGRTLFFESDVIKNYEKLGK